MKIDLSGKRAVVCGSTQGIGKACAMELAELGADVTLVARNEDALRRVQSELPASAGQSHDYIVADFFDVEALQQKISDFAATNGPVHILINNTGGPAPGPALAAELQEFREAFSSHLLCNQVLVQALVPGMKAAGYGRIINIVSTSVKQPIKDLGVSNTIRGAVANWAKTLATELGPFGVTVNNVLPGSTKTARLLGLIEAKAKKSGKSVQEVTQDLVAAIPAGRFAEAEEIAAAVAFLASPAAGYINGINLTVDGGRTLCL